MVYVVDTSSFIVLGHFFPDRFPSFWVHLNALADEGRLISAEEVWKELDRGNTKEHLSEWMSARKSLFRVPSGPDMDFVKTIFAVSHFQALVKKRSILEGTPAADPWVIACAAVVNGTVVTEEVEKTNNVRIPSVCKHFQIPCTNLQGLMNSEGWKY